MVSWFGAVFCMFSWFKTVNCHGFRVQPSNLFIVHFAILSWFKTGAFFHRIGRRHIKDEKKSLPRL